MCIYVVEITTKWQVFVRIYIEMREKMQTVEARLNQWRLQVERASNEVDDLARTHLGNEVCILRMGKQR